MVLQTGGSRHPPDDLVAGGTERRRGVATPSADALGAGPLLRGLQDGAAVLHGRGLGRLLVLRHHRACLVRRIAVGEGRVRHPWGPAGGGPRPSATWSPGSRSGC